jgi:MFS family permease
VSAAPTSGANAEASRAMKALLLAISSLTVMAGATIAPGLPGMRETFADMAGADALVRLVLTLPALFIGLAAGPAGAFLDRVGRVRMLFFAMLLYVAAGTSGTWVDSLPMLLVGRAMLGVSIAAVMTATSTIVGDAFTGIARSRYLGVQSAFMAFGGVLFLTLGGALASIGWRAPFFVYLLAVPLLPLIFVVLRGAPGTAAAPKREGPRVPIPWGTIGLPIATAFAGMALFSLVPVQIPFLLKQTGFGGAAVTGFAIATMTLTGGIASLQYRRLAARVSREVIAATTFGLMGLGYLVVAFAPNLGIVVLGLALAGLGTGLLMPNMNEWTMHATAGDVRPRALGVLNACLFGGQFVSPFLFAPFLELASLQTLFAGAAGVLVVITVAFLGLPRSHPLHAPLPSRHVDAVPDVTGT